MFRKFTPDARVISNQHFTLIDIQQIQHHREEKTVAIAFILELPSEIKQKSSKMMPGWPLGVPGHLPGASRELVRTVFATRRRLMELLKGPGRAAETILEASQAKPGPQIC